MVNEKALERITETGESILTGYEKRKSQSR